jgi:aspartyl/asparaginyl-tRNA synthetase
VHVRSSRWPRPRARPLPPVANGPALTLRVADVYSERALLGGQRVKVKGTVDRVNQVQGVHYAHLKDGTGAAAEKTDDLLCISSAALPKGETVTVEGVVALDKNVGMGVNPVVLDEAVVR